MFLCFLELQMFPFKLVLSETSFPNLVSCSLECESFSSYIAKAQCNITKIIIHVSLILDPFKTV